MWLCLQDVGVLPGGPEKIWVQIEEVLCPAARDSSIYPTNHTEFLGSFQQVCDIWDFPFSPIFWDRGP